jgi:lipopolysaccharide/colanic/teichoic acid biosynthesis glycosyltransferase
MHKTHQVNVWNLPTMDESVELAGNGDWWKLARPEDRWLSERHYLLAKRLMDLFIVCLSLPVLLPVLAICALLVKIESPGGPAILRQERTGQHGRRFGMFKLRTMVPNAEDLKQELHHLNELQWPDFKISHDPRVTRTGNLLRKTSLDEVPQILNVLIGDMSLVGPRPTSFSAATYSLWQTERLDAPPGITGLWQIIGRGATEFDVRVYIDLLYIENRSLWLDVQILIRTIPAVLLQRGVH